MKRHGVLVCDWVGLENAVRGVTFEWELNTRLGLDLETAGTAGTKSKNRDKKEAGASQVSERKVTETSVEMQAGNQVIESFMRDWISFKWGGK